MALAEGLSQQLPTDGLSHPLCHSTCRAAGAQFRRIPAEGLRPGGTLRAVVTPSRHPWSDMGASSPSYTPVALPRYLRAGIRDLPGVAEGGGKGGHVPPGALEIIWGHRRGCMWPTALALCLAHRGDLAAWPAR